MCKITTFENIDTIITEIAQSRTWGIFIRDTTYFIVIQ